MSDLVSDARDASKKIHFHRPSRKALAIGFVAFLAVIFAAAALLSLRQPSLHRQWDEDVRVLASVHFEDDGTIRLDSVRDWSYNRDSVIGKRYFDGAFDPADIVGMWLYEQELGLNGLIAHTFLVFEFDESYGDERYLGLSVETRREVGEKYSLVGGVLRAFEVTHIWATERDLVTRRVEFLDYPLTQYRVDIPPDYMARIFTRFARETDELARTPRWYHTVETNCTSALIRYVNAAEPGAIPVHYSYVLTGRADDYLRDLGYLDPDYAVRVTRDYLEANPLR